MRLGYTSIKAIMVKKNKPDVPRSDEIYDSENKPPDEEELKAYHTMFGMSDDEKR